MHAGEAATVASQMHDRALHHALAPPPQTRKRRLLGEQTASFEVVVTSNKLNTISTLAAQRAVAVAAVRAGRLRHRAAVLAGLRKIDAAIRLARIADQILAEVLS
jgi:hypothetical protein